jgi:hypothetical protein
VQENIAIDFDQNRISDAILLSIKRCLSLDGALPRTKQDCLTGIYDLGAIENGLYLSNAVIDSLAEDGDPVVYVVKTRQSIDFPLV